MSRETCLGCPIEECHVEVDGLCNRCDDIEDWLAEHDKQIRDEVIDEVISRFLSNYEELDNVMVLDIIEGILEQMKG